MLIARPPNVLVVHLKRFDFSSSKKITTKVSFPLYGLELRPYMHTVASAEEAGDSGDIDFADAVYDLHGVVVHIGTGSLHQVSVCLQPWSIAL
jgi:ubiquitin C-terminal hydrolase